PILVVLSAPMELMHVEEYKDRRTEENYKTHELGEMLAAALPSCTVKSAAARAHHPRCYRVDCSKLAATLPEFQPQWTVRRGIGEVCAAYQRYGLTREQFLGERFLRIRRIQRLQREGRVDATLRWAGDD